RMPTSTTALHTLSLHDALPISTSTVNASPTSVTADGTTTSTITVTLKDATSHPVSGKAVSLTTGSGSSTITTVNGTTDERPGHLDRKSTRLNSSHEWISYAVFC